MDKNNFKRNKKIALIGLGIFCVLIACIILERDLKLVGEKWEFRSAIVTLLFLIYYVLVWLVMKFDVISPKFFILLSLNLFHISNVIVMGFKLTEYNKYIMLYRYGENYGFLATFYSNCIIMSYVIGLVIFSKSNNYKIDIKTKQRVSQYKLIVCRKIGILIFSISLFPTLYSDLMQVTAKINGGYSASVNTVATFYGIQLGWFTKMFVPSILLLMISYMYEKKKCLRILIATIGYYSIFMFFTGRKGNTIQIIVPIICLYYHCFRPKIKINQVFVSYLGIYLVTIVTKTRNLKVDSFFWENLKKVVIEANPLTDLMLEMGGTVKAVIQIMIAIPNTGNFQFGLSFPMGIILSILNGLKIPVESLKKYAVFAEYLSQPERGSFINNTVASMGGSCIAEFYWNFGWFSILFMLIVSLLVLYYERKIQENAHNPIKLAILYSFLYYFMRYTRGYITDTVWDPLFIYIIVMICNKLFVRRYKINVSKYNNSNV